MEISGKWASQLTFQSCNLRLTDDEVATIAKTLIRPPAHAAQFYTSLAPSLLILLTHPTRQGSGALPIVIGYLHHLMPRPGKPSDTATGSQLKRMTHS